MLWHRVHGKDIGYPAIPKGQYIYAMVPLLPASSSLISISAFHSLLQCFLRWLWSLESKNTETNTQHSKLGAASAEYALRWWDVEKLPRYQDIRPFQNCQIKGADAILS